MPGISFLSRVRSQSLVQALEPVVLCYGNLRSLDRGGTREQGHPTGALPGPAYQVLPWVVGRGGGPHTSYVSQDGGLIA